jgi:hypothetical protein
MLPATLPFLNQRLQGVREHLERATAFTQTAASAADEKAAFRLRLAAVYSCRAITELMLEMAGKQQLRDPNDPNRRLNREELEALVVPEFPHYYLIERIRIHDFHRFGLLPPDKSVHTIFLGGPVKITAQAGLGAAWVTDAGLEVAVGEKSTVDLQRPLLVEDGRFFDEASATWVSLDQLLTAFLTEAPAVIAYVETLVA